MSVIDIAQARRLVNQSPRLRERATIESSVSKAAMHNTTLGMMALQTEVLLDIRDLLAECALRLSTIEAEVSAK